MTQTDAQADAAPEQAGKDRKALEALAMMFGTSMKQVATQNEAQQVAILALTAIVALSPATAAIDPEKLAMVLETLTQRHPHHEAMRQRAADYAALIVGISRKLPEMTARAKHEVEEDRAPPESKDLN